MWREWQRNVSTIYWIFERCGENGRGTYLHYTGSLRDVERMAEELICTWRCPVVPLLYCRCWNFMLYSTTTERQPDMKRHKVPEHFLKACGWVEVQLHAFLSLALDSRGRVTPGERAPGDWMALEPVWARWTGEEFVNPALNRITNPRLSSTGQYSGCFSVTNRVTNF